MSVDLVHKSMLDDAFGVTISDALQQADVTEIIVNPDGKIWIETPDGRTWLGSSIAPERAENVIRLVATHTNQMCNAKNPIVSAELPITGERFEGILPPSVSAPCFVIRKPATRIFTLQDYVAADILTPIQNMILENAIEARRNIVVAGGTASGKTTFVNALLQSVSETGQRVVLIEDTIELRCPAEDHTQLRTVPGAVSMRDLVKSSLRLRPDRIIIGEVRGGEVLDLLKAWNTGHPGGLTTLHANSARAAISRFEQLVLEASHKVPRELIAEAIDLIIFIEKTKTGRKVSEILSLQGMDRFGDYIIAPAAAPALNLIQQQE